MSESIYAGNQWVAKAKNDFYHHFSFHQMANTTIVSIQIVVMRGTEIVEGLRHFTTLRDWLLTMLMNGQ